ncbi:Putative Oxidoreductase family, NAD-binding Rossmann fold protein [Penicillium brasilianum]|uniref:Putative Oxidoreductase family, NAD-binding Rossmann fold protein n=1 Tax=Penicillium brasilianum TaxID=104259 RepID=A0A0F7TMZ1_PENBI|nr:Putative Oxidoreductase family, NAD-binding Rossmann fold protein [Penicillium brasilianum]
MAFGVALIGGGIWAKEEHLPAVLASEHLDLKAVYSRSLRSAEDTAKASGKQIELYSEDSKQGYNDVLNREDVDAVIIALPIASQASYIRAALSAGKHVLSEKPVAENVAEAEALIKWYREEIEPQKKATWSVAENFRYLNSFTYAREKVQGLGKIIGFRVKVYGNIQQDGKFFNTDWRKVPTHQGGFLLDGGVHYTAGLRYLLGPDTFITRLSAFTTLLKEHLPPVDTVDAILKANTGIQGTFQLSNGTTLVGPEWTIGCENGSVSVENSKITVRTSDGKEDVHNIEDERTGVPPEVRQWGQALAASKVNPEQSPSQALADLELLELMLRSGESEGQPQTCHCQQPANI